MKRALFAGSALVLVVGFWLGAAYYKEWRTAELGFLAQESASTFVRPHSPTLGSEDARVYIVKFTDPACETCAAFSKYTKEAMDAFPGQVRFVVRYAPFHAGADDAVRILEAARLQGKFWETLELLYRRQDTWTRHHRVLIDEIWPLLPEVGLDVERLRRDMKSPEIDAILRRNYELADALKLRGTPSFVIGDQLLRGGRGLDGMREVVARARKPG